MHWSQPSKRDSAARGGQHHRRPRHARSRPPAKHDLAGGARSVRVGLIPTYRATAISPPMAAAGSAVLWAARLLCCPPPLGSACEARDMGDFPMHPNGEQTTACHGTLPPLSIRATRGRDGLCASCWGIVVKPAKSKSRSPKAGRGALPGIPRRAMRARRTQHRDRRPDLANMDSREANMTARA